MLKCKQAAELMSQEQDRPLDFSEKLGLRFHLAMCAGCRNFRKQMAFLHQACDHYPDAGETPENEQKPV